MKICNQYDHVPLHVVVVVATQSPIKSDDITSSDHHKLRVLKSLTRVIAVSFLSLLLPLSFLLLARLSTARYYKSLANNHTSIFTLIFLKTKTTLILSLLVSLITVTTLANSLTGGRIPVFYSIRLHGAWIMLFVMQVCLSVGIHGTIDVAIDSLTVNSLLVIGRRVCLLLGLHECMIFWRGSVVKPVVDEIVTVSTELEWVEKAVMTLGLGNLWWRRLRDEAEAMVVLPWAKTEIGLEDVFGLWLYYSIVVIGVVRGGAWVLRRIYGQKNN